MLTLLLIIDGMPLLTELAGCTLAESAAVAADMDDLLVRSYKPCNYYDCT